MQNFEDLALPCLQFSKGLRWTKPLIAVEANELISFITNRHFLLPRLYDFPLICTKLCCETGIRDWEVRTIAEIYKMTKNKHDLSDLSRGSVKPVYFCSDTHGRSTSTTFFYDRAYHSPGTMKRKEVVLKPEFENTVYIEYTATLTRI